MPQCVRTGDHSHSTLQLEGQEGGGREGPQSTDGLLHLGRGRLLQTRHPSLTQPEAVERG